MLPPLLLLLLPPLLLLSILLTLAHSEIQGIMIVERTKYNFELHSTHSVKAQANAAVRALVVYRKKHSNNPGERLIDLLIY